MILAVQKQPGSNTVAVADAVQALLPVLKQSIPAGVVIGRAFDASKNIRESIGDVKFTLLLTIALVIGVIFVFLRNVSATIIPSLAVPLSLLGTFGAMKLLGYTVDMLSMMAMTLSVGFVVDDAIVMLENIVRHMEMGKTRMQASIDGRRARSRLHHRVHDRLAGSRFHSGAFSGRGHRTPLARILRHHRRRSFNLRIHFSHLDSHVVQPLSAS